MCQLCAKGLSLALRSYFTACVDTVFVHVHYEASNIMLAPSVENERLCSLTGPEWVWEQSVRS